MEKRDYKKQEKALYQPTEQPSVIDVPELLFLQVDGQGNPNEPEGAYQRAVETLYTLSYALKMLPKKGITPPGYFDYVVPPLEGLWWLADGKEFDYDSKSKFHWTAMIRQPEFVTDEVFAAACESVRLKKPGVDCSGARLARLAEGLCVQCMHLGSYDDEPASLAQMEAYMAANGLASDLSDLRSHHEIYLCDPRKTALAKRKTILRHPVRKEA